MIILRLFFLCFLFRQSYLGLLLENIADITEEVCLPELFECHSHKQHFFQTCVVILSRKINNNIAHLFCYNFFWVTKTTSSNCRECNGGHVLIFTFLKTGKYESPKKLLIKKHFCWFIKQFSFSKIRKISIET